MINKTLWFIESNLPATLTLNGLAEVAMVTPFHLARAFATATGMPTMRYVWRRRLTRAAEALVYGDAPILTIALDASYGSHEAFTRAFVAEFSETPSDLRARRRLDHLSLTHAILPRSPMPEIFAAPTIEHMPTRRIAGPVQRYDMQTRAEIPAQWGAYNDADVRAESVSPDDYYGVVFNYSEDGGSFDYLCGQEVAPATSLPKGFGSVTINGAYARFATKGHISTMSAAWGEIFGDWLTRPEYRPRPGPSVEYYPPEFDGMSGDGGYEIWVAIEG